MYTRFHHDRAIPLDLGVATLSSSLKRELGSSHTTPRTDVQTFSSPGMASIWLQDRTITGEMMQQPRLTMTYAWIVTLKDISLMRGLNHHAATTQLIPSLLSASHCHKMSRRQHVWHMYTYTFCYKRRWNEIPRWRAKGLQRYH